MQEKLNLLNDYLFMKYMGEKGDEEQLTAFLNAVLQRTGKGRISSVDIVENKALTAEIIGGKACVLDLRALLANGSKVNIEVQLRNLGNMDKRSLFYWSREFISGINSGQNYEELPNVIAINIIDFDFMPGLPEVHTCFHLWEDRHKNHLLTDALEIHFVNMYQFRQLKEEEKDIVNNPLHRWLTFFSKDTNDETIKKIIEMDRAISKAHEKVAFVSRDAETLRLYSMREMALMDYVSGINHARREGITIGEERGIIIGEQRGIIIGEQKGIAIGKQEGITIGKQETLSEYVFKLSRKGKSAAEISELTDLLPEEVNRILNR
jgi:predicted transposase/invertase (TIGR01784 family)